MKKLFQLNSACIVAFICVSWCSVIYGDEVREMPAYSLVSDDFVVRDTNAPDAIFYGYDPKQLTGKLAEYGLKFPDYIHFPQGGLFIITVTDHVQEAFDLLSADPKKRLIIVDLMVDKEFKPHKASAPGKKMSRVLVTWCDPFKDIKSFAIKSA